MPELPPNSSFEEPEIVDDGAIELPEHFFPAEPPQAGQLTFEVPRSGYWSRLPGESPELYEHLGIRFFKKYMPTTGDLMRKHFWAKRGMTGLTVGGYPEEGERELRLEALVATSKLAEKLHLKFFAGFLAFGAASGVFVGEIGSSEAGVAFSTFAGIVVNTATNVYPIMLQRYNRLRIYRILDRMNRDKNE